MHSLLNERSGAILARVARADSFWSRAVGLLPRGTIAPDEGLWIGGCGAVHTIGMRAPIDVILLDREARVVRIEYGVPPFRFAVAARGAKTVVELGAAGAPDRDLRVGDRLTLQ